jgi:hypothetical protein
VAGATGLIGVRATLASWPRASPGESELPEPPRIRIDAAVRRAFETIDAHGVVIATE